MKDIIRRVICYRTTDTNGNDVKNFIDTSLTVEDWQAKYPNAKIEYAFNLKSDRLAYSNQIEIGFNNYSENYGVPKRLLHTDFHGANDTHYEIVGLRTNARKYRFVLKNLDAGSLINCTVGYIKKNHPDFDSL